MRQTAHLPLVWRRVLGRRSLSRLPALARDTVVVDLGVGAEDGTPVLRRSRGVRRLTAFLPRVLAVVVRPVVELVVGDPCLSSMEWRVIPLTASVHGS